LFNDGSSLARNGRPAPARSRCGEIGKELGRESDRLVLHLETVGSHVLRCGCFGGTVRIVLCCRPARPWVRWCHHVPVWIDVLRQSSLRPGGGRARRSVGRVRKRKVVVRRSEKQTFDPDKSRRASIASLRQSGRTSTACRLRL